MSRELFVTVQSDGYFIQDEGRQSYAALLYTDNSSILWFHGTENGREYPAGCLGGEW
ncbi:MAG: hypothetical protein J6D08_12630 [Lachnospiraceae bacterium]|nr:hypothetical protein [Lachnospiraceae bacterium]